MQRILSISLLLFTCISVNSQISMIGTGTPSSDWITDYIMTQDPQDSDVWSITISLFSEEVKFRKNNDWAVSWGSPDFPAGIGDNFGPNIPVGQSGTYEVVFNESTAAFSFTLLSQGSVGIGISVPDSSAALEISSANQGVLFPRMNTGQIDQIANPINGLMVYNTDQKTLFAYKDGVWASIANENILQDTDQDTKIQVEENADEDIIRFDLGGTEFGRFEKETFHIGDTVRENLFVGLNSGIADTSGYNNTFLGVNSGRSSTSGYANTFVGRAAGKNNITGVGNTTIGSRAGEANSSGSSNVFIGRLSGYENSGSSNTFLGTGSGRLATGSSNTFIGFISGTSNNGNGNVFLGSNSGATQKGSNKLIIENSLADSTEALIYGEFDNDLLRVNGVLIPRDGISDIDMDTKIHLEKNADEDRIRFDVGGSEAMQINDDGRVLINTASSLGASESQVSVNGMNKAIGLEASGRTYGVRGISSGTGSSSYYGIEGRAFGSGINYGVYGSAGEGTTNWAGFFQGDVNVAKALTIDNITIQEFTGGLFNIPGSTFGSRVSGPENGHIVIDVNGNDVNDGLYVRVPTAPSNTNNNADRTMLSVNRNGVGIGVPTGLITRGRLEVDGVYYGFAATDYLSKLDGSGVLVDLFTSSATLSAFFDGRVAATEYRVFSDARVKQVIGRSDRLKDLNTLMGIKITDYTFIDTITKGPEAYKKVIAQELAEIYPNAVSNKLQEVVPDIYQTANIVDGWVKIKTDLSIGDQVKIISEASSAIYKVVSVNEEGFRVDGLTAKRDKVFVYGTLVDDFHTVDYEAISMLNVSATQAQQELIERQQSEIEELKRKVDKLIQLLEDESLVQSGKE